MLRNSRDSQIRVRSIYNDKAQAVPLACAGTHWLKVCSSRFSSAFRLNSARTATAAALMAGALGREPSANMAGTAEAASGTVTASVQLKAPGPRSLWGIFGIVSSAAEGNRMSQPEAGLNLGFKLKASAAQ
jgi:hypothetical protein